MTNAKQYTPRELFEMWLKGNHTVVELAKRYGHESTGLSHKFTAFLDERKKPQQPETLKHF